MDMVFCENGYFVKADSDGNWVVFRPSKSRTHTESDSAYHAGVDGLGVAIARAMYLSRGPGLHAKEATKLAETYMSGAKRHGRMMRDSLADFDAEFGL